MGSAKASSGHSSEVCQGSQANGFGMQDSQGAVGECLPYTTISQCTECMDGWSLTYTEITDQSSTLCLPCGNTKGPEQGMTSQRPDAKLPKPLRVQLLHKEVEDSSSPKQSWCLFLRLERPGTPSKFKLTSMDSFVFVCLF